MFYPSRAHTANSAGAGSLGGGSLEQTWCVAWLPVSQVKTEGALSYDESPNLDGDRSNRIRAFEPDTSSGVLGARFRGRVMGYQ